MDILTIIDPPHFSSEERARLRRYLLTEFQSAVLIKQMTLTLKSKQLDLRYIQGVQDSVIYQGIKTAGYTGNTDTIKSYLSAAETG
jgi:hypothetical protein